MNGSAEMMVSGNTITGYTMDGGAISVNFAFAVDPATGLDSVSGTGTVVLDGQDGSGQLFSTTGNISCNSVRSL